MKINVWAILLGAVAIICIVLQVKSCKQSRYYTDIILAKEDSLKTWQDEAGRWRTEAITAEVSKADLQIFFSQESKQIREDFDIKLKNVTGFIRANIQTRGTVTMTTDTGTNITVRNADGSDTARFHYTDPWIKFDATLFNNHLTIPYQTRDSVAFVSSFRNTGFLGMGRDKIILDGISYNPNSKISGITGIDIKVPNRRFSIGPYIGYGSNGVKWSLSAGISVHYSLIRF